ncbi:MAG: phage holin family protein [Actinobacteria bacterium]|nr:phage holin family protein [Actinomycetota bacterium]
MGLFFLRTLIFLASSALGLIVADLLLSGFLIEWEHWWGFVICIVIFTVLQSLLAPWITSMANRYAPVLLGGIGIISTFVALLVVVLLPIGGLRISDLLAWILGPVIVWLVTAVCTVVLPLLLIKREVREAAATAKAAKAARRAR